MKSCVKLQRILLCTIDHNFVPVTHGVLMSRRVRRIQRISLISLPRCLRQISKAPALSYSESRSIDQDETVMSSFIHSLQYIMSFLKSLLIITKDEINVVWMSCLWLHVNLDFKYRIIYHHEVSKLIFDSTGLTSIDVAHHVWKEFIPILSRPSAHPYDLHSTSKAKRNLLSS